MNLKELKELIELVSEKGFAEFEIERQGFRLRICRFKEPHGSPACRYSRNTCNRSRAMSRAVDGSAARRRRPSRSAAPRL